MAHHADYPKAVKAVVLLHPIVGAGGLFPAATTSQGRRFTPNSFGFSGLYAGRFIDGI